MKKKDEGADQLTSNYLSLKTSIHELDSSSEEFSMIQDYVNNTQMSNAPWNVELLGKNMKYCEKFV